MSSNWIYASHVICQKSGKIPAQKVGASLPCHVLEKSKAKLIHKSHVMCQKNSDKLTAKSRVICAYYVINHKVSETLLGRVY